MSSTRRRTTRSARTTRTALTSAFVTVAIAVLVFALHARGALPSEADAAASTGTTATTEPPAADVPEPSRASSPADLARARALLAALPVKGKAPATGYDRTADFGSPWLDVDHNGCDTRNDVLARDLTDVVRRGPCTVLSGVLLSPYSGARIDFVRGDTTSTRVQIDHVVALENAWVTGAQQRSAEQRQALANDPENLFAVDQHQNAQKRSGDAATWLPADTAFRCTYVAHQVSVKSKYGLWVAPAEHDAMVRVLDHC